MGLARFDGYARSKRVWTAFVLQEGHSVSPSGMTRQVRQKKAVDGKVGRRYARPPSSLGNVGGMRCKTLGRNFADSDLKSTPLLN